MKQRVHFEIVGERVVGDLFLPSGAGPHPAVMVGGPMTSVKEQVTGVYAAALAVRGIAAMAIDHRHYGESGGEPRQYEYSQHKIEDLRAALDWLAEHPLIDGDRLGMAGVCLGGGYAAWATIGQPQVKALGTVAGYYRDPDAMRARDPEGFAAKIEQGRSARAHYEATGEVLTVPAVALDGDAAMTLTSTFDYYGTPRAAVPNYRNEFAVMSREHFLPFDVQAAAPRLQVPTLMVHARGALSPHWAESFFAALQCEKRIEWLESPSQTDFYDDPRLVRGASDLLAEHFREHLGGSGRGRADA